MNFIISRATSSLLRPGAAAPAASAVLAVGVPVSAIRSSSFRGSPRGARRPGRDTTLDYCKFLPMPITALRHVRKMRGGAQSHLLEADDGHFYVVKFRNNPQHRRVLINELVSAVFLEYLQISAPETALVEVTSEFLIDNPEVHLTLGAQRIDAELGWHFASRYPGHPDRVAVYDFLPD